MWRLLMIAVFSIGLLGAIYIFFRFHRLSLVQRLGKAHPVLGWLACLLPIGISALFCFINIYTAAVVLLHLVLIWGLCDLVSLFFRKSPRRASIAGYIALAFTVFWMGLGWYNAHHVSLTRYTLTTDKLDAPLRVALIADSHLGITQTARNFPGEMEKLAAQQPDVLLIAGDFVDDDTPREDMLAACQALGRLELPYGVYFIYGNHDLGYYNYRNFSSQELVQALTDNGVTLLADETALVDGRFYLVGRKDRSFRVRESAAALTASLDPALYTIMLDHQPTDYDAEAAAGVDLVVSGHTHGGHLFPMGQIGLLIGPNNRRYGIEERNGAHFIVTSGISGWAVPIKTGCFSEVVVIDILPEDP